MYFDSSLAAKLSELARMNEAAAAAAGLGPETRVRCLTCDRSETVDGAHAMRFGWPRCCGATMRLVDSSLLSLSPAGASSPAPAAPAHDSSSADTCGGRAIVPAAAGHAGAPPVVAVKAAIGGGGGFPSLAGEEG